MSKGSQVEAMLQNCLRLEVVTDVDMLQGST